MCGERVRYLSVCSGIEAASVAWGPLGWTPVAFAEIDKFPCAVLKHHYPGVPNWGDLTKFRDWPDATFDVLVGGTPCQSFSVAGLRAGLADPRGNLALTYLAVIDRYRPRWVVWENVPGVLSSGRGRDFGAFLGALGALGYGFAYRVLDAQYFGLAQRRARVFVVGHLGDWRRAAAVLFERESLSGHPAPRRETGQVAPTVPCRRSAGGGLGTDFDCDGGAVPVLAIQSVQAVREKKQNGIGISGGGEPMFTLTGRDQHAVAHSLRADGFDASEDGTGRGTPIVPIAYDLAGITSLANRSNPEPGGPCHTLHKGAERSVVAFSAKDCGADAGELAPTLRAGSHNGSHANGGVMPAVAFDARQSDVIQYGEKTGPLDTDGHSMAVAHYQDSEFGCKEYDTAAIRAGRIPEHSMIKRTGMQVRRLTPRECERLQGFPDDYTLIPYRWKPAADGPRYKALGNSMAVPIMAWIGRRIQLVESVLNGDVQEAPSLTEAMPDGQTQSERIE